MSMSAGLGLPEGNTPNCVSSVLMVIKDSARYRESPAKILACRRPVSKNIRTANLLPKLPILLPVISAVPPYLAAPSSLRSPSRIPQPPASLLRLPALSAVVLPAAPLELLGKAHRLLDPVPLGIVDTLLDHSKSPMNNILLKLGALAGSGL